MAQSFARAPPLPPVQTRDCGYLLDTDRRNVS